jgi:hypothetical protein
METQSALALSYHMFYLTMNYVNFTREKCVSPYTCFMLVKVFMVHGNDAYATGYKKTLVISESQQGMGQNCVQAIFHVKLPVTEFINRVAVKYEFLRAAAI